jgi:hypothetical protein
VYVIYGVRRELFGLLVVEGAHFGAVEVLELVAPEVGLDVLADDSLVSDVCTVLHLALVHQWFQVAGEPAVEIIAKRQCARVED